MNQRYEYLKDRYSLINEFTSHVVNYEIDSMVIADALIKLVEEYGVESEVKEHFSDHS